MHLYSKILSYLLLFIATIIGSHGQAQIQVQPDESRNFIVYNSDSILYADQVRLRSDLFNDLVVRADSRRIPLNRIKFINADEGFFATINRLPGLAREEVAERVIEGRLNIFAERPYGYWAYGAGYRSRRNQRSNEQGVNMRMYFNKGYEPLERVNYRNLSLAMTDDPQSIDRLQGYRKSIRTSRAMYVGAGLAIGASIVSFLVATNNTGSNFDMQNGFSGEPRRANFTPGYIMLGVGAGLALGGYGIHFSGLKKLEKAVDFYNR